jgi:hypothetical protein
MARVQVNTDSLRFSRGESARVIVALLASLLLHLGIYGCYHTGNKLGWWQGWHLPAWLQRLEPKPYAMNAQLAHNRSEPTLFVDVSHADADAPANPKYYSNKNSRAANPEVANASIPKINGRQTDVPKTENVPKPVPKSNGSQAVKSEPSHKSEPSPDLTRLQPAMPPPSPTFLAHTHNPNAPQTPGETDWPNQNTNPQALKSEPAASRAQPERPRTLKQALAQREQIPGVQMKQAGGVDRHAMWSSLDAKATPFGDYDAAIIEAVSQRWYDLLDNHRYAEDRSGKVMLRFKLKPDGSVIEMQTMDNSVGQLLGYLCQEAIEEAAPFAKWPPDMARMIGSNYREVTFTFYYY